MVVTKKQRPLYYLTWRVTFSRDIFDCPVDIDNCVPVVGTNLFVLGVISR